ncbi:hypothetical protein LEL_04038 [Akanthomyces lecanii RCEF 1005]|uniref:Extracellular membrane protein, CFEM domain protein n=1 Tax=Akanthomyces lecanii RCEF 1005 TaxID=1081108 RepID=A0A168H225_CORDF|nr:hypothetical protein LEL_04038 [Akanthomyces lecanii RCEF 1005]
MKVVIATLFIAVAVAAAASAADLDTFLHLAEKGKCAIPCVSATVNGLGCKEAQGPIDLICANLQPIMAGSTDCLTKCELNQHTQDYAMKAATKFCDKHNKHQI